MRDGPFSNFRSSSNTHPRRDAVGESPLNSKSGKKTLSDADIEALNAPEKQDPNAAVDGPLVTDTGRDEDREAADELNDMDSEAEHDLAEDEDELGSALEDDKAQQSRWQSDILCVVDPFIRTKVVDTS